MEENVKTSQIDTETSLDSKEPQSIISRVSNLPLVSSACDAVSSAYSSTKDNVPLLRGVMDAAESGVRTLGAAASMGTKPILDRLEPQIAMVNEYAMKGMDKVEEKLPILHQPTEKVLSPVMEENVKTTEMDTETSLDSKEPQSVMSWMSSLPLVSSACDAVSSAYSSTKDNVPLLRGVMDAAESGVRTLGAAASMGTKPILDRLEPQIAVVNDYAMKRLDKVEEQLPILHQPADKLVSETMEKVYQSVTGAKDTVVGAMLGGVEMTRTAVVEGINTVMGTRVGQMVNNGVGLALTHSEDWVDQHLPLTEKELAALAEPLPNEEGGATMSSAPNYFVRLGKLSAKVRERALELSLIKVQNARETTHSAVTQITSTLDLLEITRTTLVTHTTTSQLGGATEQLMKRWKEWKEGTHTDKWGQEAEEVEEDEAKDQEAQLEWRTLSLVRGLSEQLQMACAGIVSSAQGLPGAVQEQLQNARRTAEDLHSSLGKTSILTPLLLQQSRQQLAQVRQSLDGVTEYLLNNTPLNWLVGPFSPQLTEKRQIME